MPGVSNDGRQWPVVDPRDIECMAKRDEPPLIRAVRGFHKHPQKVYDALAAGEDVNSQDKLGYTPLMLACKSRNAELVNLLCENSDLLKLDLQNKRGFTALMMAASMGMVDQVIMLVALGADVNIKDSGGRTVWGVAVDKQEDEVLEALFRRGHNYTTSGMTLPIHRMAHRKYGPHVKHPKEHRAAEKTEEETQTSDIAARAACAAPKAAPYRCK